MSEHPGQNDCAKLHVTDAIMEDDALITTLADDVYHTFYRSAENEAMLAKGQLFLLEG